MMNSRPERPANPRKLFVCWHNKDETTVQWVEEFIGIISGYETEIAVTNDHIPDSGDDVEIRDKQAGTTDYLFVLDPLFFNSDSREKFLEAIRLKEMLLSENIQDPPTELNLWIAPLVKILTNRRIAGVSLKDKQHFLHWLKGNKARFVLRSKNNEGTFRDEITDLVIEPILEHKNEDCKPSKCRYLRPPQETQASPKKSLYKSLLRLFSRKG